MKKKFAMMIVAAAFCLLANAAAAFETVSEYKADDKIGMMLVTVKIHKGDVSGVSGAVSWVFGQKKLKPKISWAEAVVQACIINYDSADECNRISRLLKEGDEIQVIVPTAPLGEVEKLTANEARKPLEAQVSALDIKVAEIAKERDVAELELAKIEERENEPCPPVRNLLEIAGNVEVRLSDRCAAQELLWANKALTDKLETAQKEAARLRKIFAKITDWNNAPVWRTNLTDELLQNVFMFVSALGLLSILVMGYFSYWRNKKDASIFMLSTLRLEEQERTINEKTKLLEAAEAQLRTRDEQFANLTQAVAELRAELDKKAESDKHVNGGWIIGKEYPLPHGYEGSFYVTGIKLVNGVYEASGTCSCRIDLLFRNLDQDHFAMHHSYLGKKLVHLQEVAFNGETH